MLAQAEVTKELGSKFVEQLELFADMALDRQADIVLMSLFVIICIGSAAFASSIAESRLRSRNLHFLIGLVFPVVYPLVAWTVLPRRRHAKKVDDTFVESVKIDGPPPVEGPALPPVEATPVKASVDDDFSSQTLAYNQGYFKGLLFDENGNVRGPFIMSIDDTEIRVERILDVMDQVVVLETINADGKQQTLRIPFGRVASCREL